MVVLLVDGDYLLSGFKPTSDAEVRAAVQAMEDAMTKQLLTPVGGGSAGNTPPTYQARIDVRVALFSSALINSLSDGQRHNVISAFRKLRFQTTVLESVSGRPGSPIDAALCTKAIMFAMMPTAAAENATAGAGGSAGQVFCFVSPNAYIGSALDLITQRGCEAVFTVYEGDEVAEELLGYVSAAYGSGIATMPKKPGVSFIPNTEAASAALAALQQEGKDLPLAVLKELKLMQESLTTRRRPSTAGHAATVHNGSGDAMASILDESRRKVQQEQHKVAPPPPLANVPSPFDPVNPHQPSAPSEADHPPTPYVYHGDDDKDEGPMPKLTQPTNSGSTPSSNADRPGRNGAFAASETFIVTTATSPQDVSRAAVPPTAAPPVSACALVNAPPAEVTAEPGVSANLPAFWALVFDKHRRRHFFAYRDSEGRMQATWEHPLGPAEQRSFDEDVQAWYQHERNNLAKAQPVPSQQPQPQQQAAPGDAGDALPAGWEERIDPRSGRKFYINHQTKETTWNPPAAVAARPSSTPSSTPHPSSVANGHESSLTALPPFWEEKVDPRNGRTYYINHQTRETTWTRPSRVVTAPQQPQPQPAAADESADWETRVDAQGRTFYVNHKLQRTSWTKPGPTAAIPALSASEIQPPTRQQPQQKPSSTALPPFWEERIDPRSGRAFFVNHQTRETTWTRPSHAG